MLSPLQVHARGARAALQEPRDRQDDREGQADDEEAGEAAAAWRRRERQVDLPQADEDHTRRQVSGGSARGARSASLVYVFGGLGFPGWDVVRAEMFRVRSLCCCFVGLWRAFYSKIARGVWRHSVEIERV